MIEEIRNWAEGRDEVRAVILTGSRARSGAETDALSDFDVALFVDDAGALADDPAWFEDFGSVLVSIPDSFEELGQVIPTRLVVYEGGRRIDFSIFSRELLRVIAYLPELPPWLDEGYRVLHDPEGLTGSMVPPFGRGWAGRPPDAEEVVADIEEFWWEALVVGKHLARGHGVAAAYSMEAAMRHGFLRKMLEWRAGASTGWARSAGLVGRGLESMLPPELLERARPAGTSWKGERGWSELERLCDLFAELARAVCDDVGAAYPERVEAGVRARLGEIGRSTGASDA